MSIYNFGSNPYYHAIKKKGRETMNEATKRFLKAVAQDPTLTDEQKLLIQIVADLNEETVDKVIDRLSAQAGQARHQPLQETDHAQR